MKRCGSSRCSICPAFGRTPKRVSWSKLPQSFRDDPASLEMAARARIAKSLERYVRSPRTSSIKGFASGARGGDILFHEECRRRMIDTVIVIPFAPDVFIQTSVALGTDSDNWPKRFWQLWNGTPPEQRHVLSLEASNNAYTVCNIRLLELAAQHGRVHLIALWDGKAGDGPGGTADLISKVKAEDEPDIFSSTAIVGHPITRQIVRSGSPRLWLRQHGVRRRARRVSRCIARMFAQAPSSRTSSLIASES
jgi:hypothetical protein